MRQTTNNSGDLEFLDLNINLNVDRKISCHQKTVHRNFKAISDWQSFDVAPMKNQEILSENQYPIEWSTSIVNETLVKKMKTKTVTAKSHPPKINNIPKKLSYQQK